MHKSNSRAEVNQDIEKKNWRWRHTLRKVMARKGTCVRRKKKKGGTSRRKTERWEPPACPPTLPGKSHAVSSLLVAHAAHTPRCGIISAQQGMMRWEVGGARHLTRKEETEDDEKGTGPTAGGGGERWEGETPFRSRQSYCRHAPPAATRVRRVAAVHLCAVACAR